MNGTADSQSLARTISVAAGLIMWVALSWAAGNREAWDAAIYWWLGVPLLAGAAALAGYLAPVRVWRWAVYIVLGHLIGIVFFAFASDAGFGLLLLAVIFVLVPLALILTGPAIAGGMVRRGGWVRELWV